MKEILQTKIYYEERVPESCLDQIILSHARKLNGLTLSQMLENGWHASLPLKVFRPESLKGEGRNTLGVYHQLSSGFELKHDRLSDVSFMQLMFHL
jgi:hypothetical protein